MSTENTEKTYAALAQMRDARMASEPVAATPTTRDAIYGAAKHLASHEAGEETLITLQALFGLPALDSQSQMAVRILMTQYFGSMAGTVIDAVHDVLEEV